jgi:hypothetical protein
MRNSYNTLVEKPERGEHFGHLGADGTILLKCILNKWDTRV